MKRWISAVNLLVTAWLYTIGYWLTVTGFLALVSLGMQATSDSTATLWGLRLERFGFTSEQIQTNAFIEMMHHAWTVVTLPFLCFVGMQPLLRSFRTDFGLFVRFSHSSLFFVEATRWLASLVAILLAAIPFAVWVLWGHLRPGLEWHSVWSGLVSCTVTTIFIAGLIYLLASWSVPSEIAVSIGMVAPFMIEGVSVFAERTNRSHILQWFPPGLPYSIESPLDPSVRAAVLFFAMVTILRLFCVAHTRWLLADQ